jgi:hypothetical protein
VLKILCDTKAGYYLNQSKCDSRLETERFYFPPEGRFRRWINVPAAKKQNVFTFPEGRFKRWVNVPASSITWKVTAG